MAGKIAIMGQGKGNLHIPPFRLVVKSQVNMINTQIRCQAIDYPRNDQAINNPLK